MKQHYSTPLLLGLSSLWLLSTGCADVKKMLGMEEEEEAKTSSGIPNGTYLISGPFCVVDGEKPSYTASGGVGTTGALAKQASMGDLRVSSRTLNVDGKNWTRTWIIDSTANTCTTTIAGRLAKNGSSWIENRSRVAVWAPEGCKHEVNDGTTTGGSGTGAWVTADSQYGTAYNTVSEAGNGPTWKISKKDGVYYMTLSPSDAAQESGYICSDDSKNIRYEIRKPSSAKGLGTIEGGSINGGQQYTSNTRVLVTGTMTGSDATGVDFFFDSACATKVGSALAADFTAGTWFEDILTTGTTTIYARPTGPSGTSTECVSIGSITYDGNPPTATCWRAESEKVDGIPAVSCSPKMPDDMPAGTVDQGNINKTNLVTYTGDKSQPVIEWLTGPTDAEGGTVSVYYAFSSEINDPNSCALVSSGWESGLPTIANLEALTTYNSGSQTPQYTLCLMLEDGRGNFTYIGYWRKILMIVP